MHLSDPASHRGTLFRRSSSLFSCFSDSRLEGTLKAQSLDHSVGLAFGNSQIWVSFSLRVIDDKHSPFHPGFEPGHFRFGEMYCHFFALLLQADPGYWIRLVLGSSSKTVNRARHLWEETRVLPVNFSRMPPTKSGVLSKIGLPSHLDCFTCCWGPPLNKLDQVNRIKQKYNQSRTLLVRNYKII